MNVQVCGRLSAWKMFFTQRRQDAKGAKELRANPRWKVLGDLGVFAPLREEL
jgi:hypothetical protein